MTGPRAASPLSAAHLTVRYGETVAVSDLALRVQPGEMVALRGPSGAGKTSALWALLGAQPHSGEVTYAGETIGDYPDAAERGFVLVPQGNGLTGSLTAVENILVPLLSAGISPKTASERAAEALRAVGLEESGTHLIEELSGGQQQRVAVARALAAYGAVVLADEPTSDLDASNRERVMGLLRAEADAGAIVIVATHDPAAAAQADRELRLDAGQLVP